MNTRSIRPPPFILRLRSGRTERNLLDVYQALTSYPQVDIENEFAGKGYGALKSRLVEVTIEKLRPIQSEYLQIVADPTYIDSILASGSRRAQSIAEPILSKIKDAIGYYK